MAQKTILVTGANGQLGNELKRLESSFPQYNFLFEAKSSLSIENPTALSDYFAAHSIDCCINCAAYTAVDKAETDTANAFLVNGEAVGSIAKTCADYGALFIHISTDYVFDGTSTLPYREDDPVNPVNLYGASKLKGEELAGANNADALIIRTSWLYGTVGNNFVKTMMRLMKQADSINVVSDQQGCPTYAADLAEAILLMIIKLDCSVKSLQALELSSGIFHYSNAGVTTWYEFAVAIKELSGSSTLVNPIPTASYPTPARRPSYSVMDTSKITEVFNLAIPHWKDSLKRFMLDV